MPATITERLRNVLIDLAESEQSNTTDKLEATRQLIELSKPKQVRGSKAKKAVSSLLGSK